MKTSRARDFFFPPKTFVYWAAMLLLGLLFLALFRASFLFSHRHLAPGIPLGDIAYSFLMGARFDMAVLAFLFLPFCVVSFMPGIGFEYSRPMRRTLQAILYTALSGVFLLCLADIEYYREFGDHLGIWLYAYLDHFQMVWYGISSGYPVALYLGLWAAVMAIFIFLVKKLHKIFKRPRETHPVSRWTYPVALLALLIIAMRGGTSLAPLDWGSAYHSNYGFANDLSLNGIFTLGKSLYETYSDNDKNNPSRFHFTSSREALERVQDLVSLPGDSLTDPERSLKRLSLFGANPASDQNVVIVVLESWSAKFVGALGGSPGATPYFDSLSEKGLLFENFFASGLRTNRGLLSILCSFPSLPGRSVMKRYGAPHPFSSIADILGERGYESYFIYGGELAFENMEGFFRGQGFESFVGVEDFPAGDILNKWGVPDHLVLERANEMFSKTKGPFLGVVVTLTNHEPFKVPGPEFEVFPESLEYYEYLNTFHYSDWALGHFFRLAEREEYFKNTIFVLVGDHGKVLDRPDDMLHNFRIASLVYCPGRTDITPRRISKLCGQVDILPTVLGLLGQPVIHESWGRDILSGDTIGYAVLNKNDSFAWIEDSLMLCGGPGMPTKLHRFPDDSLCQVDISASFPEEYSRMRARGEAMLQLEVEMVHVEPEFKKTK